MDFYGISTYEKDPRKRSFAGELEMGKVMLEKLREIFPDQHIFFMVGNHEERLERYMRVKAPELLDCDQFKIQELLGFDALGIHVIKDKRMVKQNNRIQELQAKEEERKPSRESSI